MKTVIYEYKDSLGNMRACEYIERWIQRILSSNNFFLPHYLVVDLETGDLIVVHRGFYSNNYYECVQGSHLNKY